MPSAATVLQDPNFHALPLEERRKVLLKLDENFGGLPALEQDKVLQTQLPPRVPSPVEQSVGSLNDRIRENVARAGIGPGEKGDSLLKQAASSVAETAAGVADLPALVGTKILDLLGIPYTHMPSATSMLEPHLSAPPTTTAGTLVRSGAGPAALLAAGPLAMGAGAGAVATEAAIGAGSGIGAHFGGETAKALGVPEVAGELIGGALAPGVATAGRIATSAVRGGRAASEAARLADEAVTTAERGVVDAEQRGAAHVAATEQETAARLDQVQNAQSTETAAQRATLKAAQTTAATRTANADQAVAAELRQESPIQRAALLRDAMGENRTAFAEHRRLLYKNFFDTHGDIPVPLNDLKLNSTELVERFQSLGLPPDAASQEAKRLLDATAGPVVNLREADEIRATIGRIYAKAQGPTRARATGLFKTIDNSIQEAVTPDVYQQLQGLRTVYRIERNRYANTYVARALDDTEEGRTTAIAYVSRMLASRWTPAKQQEVGTLVKAAGSNTTAHEVLKDALFRNAIAQSTRKVAGTPTVDWELFANGLRHEDGLAPAFRGLVPDIRERARFLKAADDAARGARELAAAERLQPPTWTSEAEQARRAVVGEAGQTARAGVSAARATVGAARSAATTAQAAAPPQGLTVLDFVLGEVGYQAGGIKGAIIAPLGRHVLRWMRNGTNRTLLRDAARSSVDSTTGRRLLQTFTAIGARLQRPVTESGTAFAAPTPSVAPPAAPSAP